MWFIAAFGLAVYWGGIYLHENAGAFHPLVFDQGDTFALVEGRVPKSEADDLIVQGRKVYTVYCLVCHQPNGRGVPGDKPPLAESDWVLVGGPNRLIRIVLNGLQGPITVKGQDFNNVMLPWRDQLSDQDIAAVLTFVRGNKEWGNTAPPVSAAQVKPIREATKDRASSWTPPELLALPEQD
jgi:mono/diheme cytochrome c family protein